MKNITKCLLFSNRLQCVLKSLAPSIRGTKYDFQFTIHFINVKNQQKNVIFVFTEK